MNYQALFEAKILPLVIRPARYIGNEWGAVHKTAVVRVVLAVADKYDRGMAEPELLRLYRLFNAEADLACERVFAPDVDAEKLLKEENLPLFSLESLTPIADCDWLHFLISDPLHFSALTTILKSGQLPLRSNERSEVHPLISASSVKPFNPEPIADLLDFFFCGEVDTALAQLRPLITSRRALDRAAVWSQLTQIPGMYVPSLYQPQYNGDRFAGLTATAAAAPAKMRARSGDKSGRLVVPILPYEEITGDRVNVFLGSSVDVAKTVEFVDRALQQTGYDEVSFHGDLVAGIKNFDQLTTQVGQRFRDRHIAVTLPALPPVAAAIEYQRAVTFAEKQTLRFALLSGSERLREAHGHYAGLDQFYQVLANAYASGWRSVRLDFEIGLPQESARDIEDAIAVIRNCDAVRAEYGDKYFLHVTLSPAQASVGSEWQWDALTPPTEYQARCDRIQKSARGRNIQYRVREAGAAYLRAVLARGDRRLGEAILSAHERGARFDGWNEHFNFELWTQVCAECGLPVDKLAAEIPLTANLPWDHLDYGQSSEDLRRRRQTAFPAETVRKESAGFKLGDIILAKPELAEQILAVPESAPSPSQSFGRRPKRTPVQAVAMVVPRSRVRVQWRKEAPARFIGHLATMRMFERALRRAEIPVSFSQGFHPRPRLSFGPPLSVGYTSEAEYFDIQLEAPYQDTMLDRLNRALPAGFTIVQGRTVFGKAASVSSQINLACYAVELPESCAIAQKQIDSLLEQPTIIVERIKADEKSEVDVRNSIIALELQRGDSVNLLRMELALGNLGFVRPDEVLAFGFGWSSREILSLNICRTALIVLFGKSRLSPFEVSG